jgi:ABC-2 type transport system ATP-binding protein
MKTVVFGRQVEFRIKPSDAQLAEIIQRFSFIKSTQVESNRLLLGLENPEESNPLIVKALVDAGVEVQFVSEVRHSLEDVYLSLINNGTTR